MKYYITGVIVVLFGASIFFLYSKDDKKNNVQPQFTASDVPNIRIEDREPPKGNKEYQSRKYRFSLFFPAELSITQYSVPGNGQNIIFESQDGTKGFQIYVFPYNEDHVTEERYKMDIPTGVMKDPIDIAVGGVQARTFTSRDVNLGETQEVWILNNGFLYEITSLKSEEEMLVEVMSSWKFY